MATGDDGDDLFTSRFLKDKEKDEKRARRGGGSRVRREKKRR
jgi:hypothetical protein